MKSYKKNIVPICLVIGLLASLIYNFNQQNKIKCLNKQVRFQNDKLSNFAFKTGKIINKYAKININQLVKDNLVMKPFDDKRWVKSPLDSCCQDYCKTKVIDRFSSLTFFHIIMGTGITRLTWEGGLIEIHMKRKVGLIFMDLLGMIL